MRLSAYNVSAHGIPSLYGRQFWGVSDVNGYGQTFDHIAIYWFQYITLWKEFAEDTLCRTRVVHPTKNTPTEEQCMWWPMNTWFLKKSRISSCKSTNGEWNEVVVDLLITRHVSSLCSVRQTFDQISLQTINLPLTKCKYHHSTLYLFLLKLWIFWHLIICTNHKLR